MDQIQTYQGQRLIKNRQKTDNILATNRKKKEQTKTYQTQKGNGNLFKLKKFKQNYQYCFKNTSSWRT